MTPKILLLVLCVAISLTSPCEAKKRDSISAPEQIQPFQEQCADTAITYKQAKWNCSNRGYRSASQLVDDLKSRFPHGQWKLAGNDPALKKIQGKNVWWDCEPNKEICGYWVMINEDQFVFLQQLVDLHNNNQWQGVGVTTFCAGKKSDCQKLIRQAASIFDDSVDFSRSGSAIGPPPFSPPLPPGYKPAI